ncbi:lysophospholipid acyltransferase family protein [Litorimonas sp. WD9-15]|uniref:lysophospholipid acyltransferase family protein n=1 Tax=Litorimonas sp. WD9-15 TaxID=3418716 RepID=UPI003CFCA8B0
MFKRFLRRPAVQSGLGWGVAQYMRLIKATTRWDIRHPERVEDIIAGRKGVIALTWHSRFLMLTSAWKREYQLPYVMISRSRDGAVVAATCKALGLQTLRGSSKKRGKNKGGEEAAAGAVTAVKSGGCVVITPDGPRGPRQRLGDGPLRLARATGAPIMPCTFAVARRKQFDSWDKFVLPKLFGKGLIIWGTPVTISKHATDEELENIRLFIETEMNALLAEADKSLGHIPVAPA